MRRGSQLSMMLHALLHMAQRSAPVTSEALAKMLHTNPVVVRRMMAGLRTRGVVHSDKGHGGGWTLLRTLAEFTLGDVYDALGTPTVFAMGNRVESPGCLVEQAVNRAMDSAFGEAEALLVARLRSVSLAVLAADVAHMPSSITTRKRKASHV